jgi:phytoene desaturase
MITSEVLQDSSVVPTSQPDDTGTPIVVIGSGFGGLASAIRLQAAGYSVTIVEAREKPGGRAYQLVDAGYTFDMGPSLITEPHLLADIWRAAGRDIEDYVDLVQLAPYYRVYFQDGRYFDYGASHTSDESEISKFNERDIAGFNELLVRTEEIYNRAFSDLADQPFDQLKTFLDVAPELLRLRAHRSVYQLVSEYISDPNLRAVFSFHPLFIGGNPFKASAIYSIIPFLERKNGVYFAMGGTYAIVTAMIKLFEELGGRVVLGESVERILTSRGKVAGVRTNKGRRFRAGAVVANSDVGLLSSELVASRHQSIVSKLNHRRYRYSMSCYLLYLGTDRQFDKLLHHTIVMPRDYKRAISSIFGGAKLPDDLAFYVHAPTKTDPSMAPPGGESLYVLVPVPNLAALPVDWSEMAPRFRDTVVQFLEDDFGLESLEASIQVEHSFTPADFETELQSLHGSAFSIEPTLSQSAYFRPHNRSRDLEGLYVTGAGTHPGAGVPGVLLSAKITSALVAQDVPAQANAPVRSS